MSYIRLSSKIEYDPTTCKILSDGVEKDAGFASIGFALCPEVQEVLAASAAATSSSTSSTAQDSSTRADSPWSPYTGPVDDRDAKPTEIGLLTASGAPQINISTDAAANACDYTGPASHNPYFTTSSNPLREGYVEGYESWFASSAMAGPAGGYTLDTHAVATAEGAQEALRIAKQFDSGATLNTGTLTAGSEDQWQSQNPVPEVVLSSGAKLYAGSILALYYHNGMGADSSADGCLGQQITALANEPVGTYA